MSCPVCGCGADTNIEAMISRAQEQQLTYLARQRENPLEKLWMLGATHSPPLGYARDELGVRLQAILFFEDNPELSGWRDTAAEWSKIP